MHINDNTNYTTLPLELSCCLPSNHVVFTIKQIVNDLDDNRFQVFYHHFGRPSYHPKMLLSALLFAYSQGIFSGRKIEKLMLENLIRDLFIELNLRLKMAELVTLDCLFIDGAKIEANANKYSFVWRKATDKFSAKLQTNLHLSPKIKKRVYMKNGQFKPGYNVQVATNGQ